MNWSWLTVIIVLFSMNGYSQKIAAGGWHSLVVCTDSTVKAFGENATGQLGNGNNTDQPSPVTPTGLPQIIAVSGGGDQLEAHSLALGANGKVYSWGSNLYGGLGNGTLTNTNIPGQVLLLTDAIQISAGGWHSVALKADGTVWTWGWNIDGQIGDGTFTDRILPTMVPGLTNVIQVVAGTYHNLALKNDGTVWAWGDNVSGQIGDGTTTDRTTPVQVSNLSGVSKIAAGRFFSLAIKNDGTVWTWGENLYGQLGNGNTTDSHVPVQVSGLNGITTNIVAVGAFHCLIVKDDGTVWAWGRNTYGNLGDGTTTHRSTPVQTTGITDVVGMAAGTNFSLLYKADGTFWGLGRNASGQLGDGTLLQRNTVNQSTLVCPIQHPVSTGNEIAINKVNLHCFPNPTFTGKINIVINNDDFYQVESGIISVHNTLGDCFLTLPLTKIEFPGQYELDLSNIPNGIYFIRLNLGEQTLIKKIIKL